MIGPSAPNGPPEPIEIAEDNRLQKRDFRLDAAAIDQNRFNRFRNAVSADSLRAVARHHADDQRSGDRHENAVNTEMVAQQEKPSPYSNGQNKIDW